MGDKAAANKLRASLPVIGKYVLMENLSMAYGWTPDQIRKMKLYDLLAYAAIAKGRSKPKGKKAGSGAMSGRTLRKMV